MATRPTSRLPPRPPISCLVTIVSLGPSHLAVDIESTGWTPRPITGLPVSLVSLASHLVGCRDGPRGLHHSPPRGRGVVGGPASCRPRGRISAVFRDLGSDLVRGSQARAGMAGQPERVGHLFLIPLPWVAPVWAPVTVATLFMAAGSYLLWTSERARRYRWPDFGVLAAATLLTIAAFLVEWKAAADHRIPERFPMWLFWAGVVVGTAWFLRVERRAAKEDARTPWVGVRVQRSCQSTQRQLPENATNCTMITRPMRKDSFVTNPRDTKSS